MHKYSKIRGVLRAKQGSQIPKYILGGDLDIFKNPANVGLFKGNILSNELLLLIGQYQPSGLDWQPESNLYENNTVNPLNKEFNVKFEGLSKRLLNSLKYGPDLWDKLKGKVLNKFGTIDLNTIYSGIDLGINLLSSQFNDTEDTTINKTGLWGSMGIGKIFGQLYGLAFKGLAAGLQGLNSLTGKNTIAAEIDQDALSNVGGSWQGLVNDSNKALSMSEKHYGGITGNAKRRKNNSFIADINRKNKIVSGISKETNDLKALVNDLNYISYYNDTNGVLDPRFMRIGKSGMKLLDKINLVKSRKFNQVINVDTKLIEEFKLGGKLTNTDWEPEIELFGEWEPVIELEMFQKGGKTRTLEELIEYAKKENPRFIQRLSEPPHGIEFIDDEGNKGIGNVYLEWSTDDEGNAVIYPRILEMEDKSLKFLSSNEAWKRANKNNNILVMSPEEANIFFAEDSEYQTAYKRGWPEMFKNYSKKVESSTKELKEGGTIKEELETPEIEETNQKNLIPEGALHKNKHHMEHTEGLTQKGIPVIDNEGELLAEIELDEIIFTLEVTKKLEELYKEGTDEAAIEAGKLLVKEILFNTDDRTSLIEKILI